MAVEITLRQRDREPASAVSGTAEHRLNLRRVKLRRVTAAKGPRRDRADRGGAITCPASDAQRGSRTWGQALTIAAGVDVQQHLVGCACFVIHEIDAREIKRQKQLHTVRVRAQGDGGGLPVGGGQRDGFLQPKIPCDLDVSVKNLPHAVRAQREIQRQPPAERSVRILRQREGQRERLRAIRLQRHLAFLFFTSPGGFPRHGRRRAGAVCDLQTGLEAGFRVVGHACIPGNPEGLQWRHDIHDARPPAGNHEHGQPHVAIEQRQLESVSDRVADAHAPLRPGAQCEPRVSLLERQTTRHQRQSGQRLRFTRRAVHLEFEFQPPLPFQGRARITHLPCGCGRAIHHVFIQDASHDHMHLGRRCRHLPGRDAVQTALILLHQGREDEMGFAGARRRREQAGKVPQVRENEALLLAKIMHHAAGAAGESQAFFLGIGGLRHRAAHDDFQTMPACGVQQAAHCGRYIRGRSARDSILQSVCQQDEVRTALETRRRQRGGGGHNAGCPHRLQQNLRPQHHVLLVAQFGAWTKHADAARVIKLVRQRPGELARETFEQRVDAFFNFDAIEDRVSEHHDLHALAAGQLEQRPGQELLPAFALDGRKVEVSL